ncbi:MAG: DsbA family protein [Actinomycetota bacterium]|nr:DsbA family protein [Actinomycetota bacterium]
MAGSSTASFYFDLGSPDAYLAAERALQVLPGVEWIPVLAAELPGHESWEAFRCCNEREIALAGVELVALQRGLQPLRWPDPFPFDATLAMHVATYARQIGRTVPFAQAAFRQAFAGGRALDSLDNVVIAAAACEMHPAAVRKGAELRTVRDALRTATADAVARGVRDVPAVATADGRVFHGDAQLERAASPA